MGSTAVGGAWRAAFCRLRIKDRSVSGERFTQQEAAGDPCSIMWTVTLVFVSYVAAQVTSQEIKAKCVESIGFPPTNNISPSGLAELNVKVLTIGGNSVLNISWAISIDASVQYLTGTRLTVDGNPHYLCEYKPSFAEAELTGSKKKWFHHLVEIDYGHIHVQASNLPLSPLGSGPSVKSVTVYVPRSKPSTPVPFLLSTGQTLKDVTTVEPITSPLRKEHITVAIFGGMAGLLILCFCYIIYKNCKANIAKSFGLQCLQASPMVPVPVLMVYSADTSAFHQAVVALAEFLQWHGGCSVAVDMWQQGKIAELGPMRWLVEQIKAADRVLIVCPQVENPSPQPSHSTSSPHSCPQPSIPAAAHDLFPMILNMVASHAKSSSELAKFWVVQLGQQQDKRPSNVALELRACKTFCLMKNLNKLCRSLHTHGQDSKIPELLFRPGISYSEKSTAKLREAVKKLIRHQPCVSSEMEPLKSVVMSF